MKRKINGVFVALATVLVVTLFVAFLIPREKTEMQISDVGEDTLPTEISHPAEAEEIVVREENTAVKPLPFEGMTFIDFRSGKECTIFTLPQVNDDYMGEPARYSMIDLDGDGTKEILVEYSIAGDTAIINKRNGNATAYYMEYRGRQEVKTDGTMHWSAGASESGVHRVSFGKDGLISTDIIIYSDKLYSVNGKAVSKEECEKAMQEEWKKADVEWFDIA